MNGLREDGELTFALVGHLPRDLVRLMTVVTNEELEMSTCEVARMSMMSQYEHQD